MRSFWIGRLFRHTHGVGQVLIHPSISQSTLIPLVPGKGTGIQASVLRNPKSARLCLGIGDGIVHRQ